MLIFNIIYKHVTVVTHCFHINHSLFCINPVHPLLIIIHKKIDPKTLPSLCSHACHISLIAQPSIHHPGSECVTHWQLRINSFSFSCSSSSSCMKVSQVKEHIVAKTIERNEGERINLAIFVHHVPRGMWD